MLKSQIESVLFVCARPLTIKELAKICNRTKDEVEVVLEDLKNKYNNDQSGIRLIMTDNQAQLVADPKNKEIIEGLVKEEVYSDLTQPQLEALTIIAYRGPVTKFELEQIRGVNCSLILRNLIIKRLIEVKEEKIIDNNTYTISTKFLQHLGINSAEELPDYERLSKSETLDELLKEAGDKA